MKIVGCGLAKTGTSTLAAALRILGYNAVHDFRVSERIAADLWLGQYPEALDTADAFTDFPHIERYFEKLVGWLPDAKVILTVRPEEEWLRSCLVHVLHSRVTGDSPWVDIDTAALQRERAELHAMVTAWGAEHPGRLLIFDVREGWGPLCEFLGKEEPSAPFPRENSGARRLEEVLARYRAA